MSGWIIFAVSMAIPGFAEMYAAFKLLPFLRHVGGILPFLFCFLSGLFDVSFALIVGAILILGGELVIELPLDNLLVLGVVIFIVGSFFLWRIASSLLALWFAGILDDGLVRRAIKIEK